MIVRIVKISFWTMFIIGVLLILSITKNKHENLKSEIPSIYIKIKGDNSFLTQKELLTRLKRKGYIFENQVMKFVKLKEIENLIKSMSEIKDVSVYKGVDNKWFIDVELRNPIARIFNIYGESFYIDEDGYKMTTSNLYTARVLVFSGNIYERMDKLNVEKIINNESLKTKFFLDDIYRISYYVCSSPFWSSLFGQVYVEKNGDFILLPQVGKFKIVFGKAKNNIEVRKKMDKLWLFYSNALPFEGWNKYELINLKFRKQIICKKIELK